MHKTEIRLIFLRKIELWLQSQFELFQWSKMVEFEVIENNHICFSPAFLFLISSLTGF